MNRKPFAEAPLTCYGLEHNEDAKVCRRCPHQEGCVVAMGRRRGRVPLSKVEFSLVPEAIDKAAGVSFNYGGPDDDTNEAYAECYERVFDRRPPPNRRYFKDEEAAVIRAKARECKLSFKSYMTASMLAWQASYPDATFYAKNLLGDRALRRVEEYRDTVKTKHGFFDAETMENFLYGEETKSLEQRMFHSEVTAGEWIVGFKIRHAGAPLASFYEAKELALDPLWLAIEPSYRTQIFDPYLKDPDSADKTRRAWRHTVGQTMRALKTSGRDRWGRARYLFRCREAVAGKAVERVLSYYGLRPADLEIEGGKVEDMVRLWSRVGLAVQHWLCLRWRDGDESAERMLASRKPKVRLSGS